MPIYKYKGDVYNIPDNLAAEFESRFGDATIDLWVGSDQYEIPIAEKKDFLSVFSNASTERTFDGFSLPKLDTSGAVLANDAVNSDFANGKAKFPEKQRATQEAKLEDIFQRPAVNPVHAANIRKDVLSQEVKREDDGPTMSGIHKKRFQDTQKAYGEKVMAGKPSTPLFQTTEGGNAYAESIKQSLDAAKKNAAQATEEAKKQEAADVSAAKAKAVEMYGTERNWEQFLPKQQGEKPITGAWEGLKQGTEQALAGLQYLGGETLSTFTGSRREPAEMLAEIENLKKYGTDDDAIVSMLEREAEVLDAKYSMGGRAGDAVAAASFFVDGKEWRKHNMYQGMGFRNGQRPTLDKVVEYLQKEAKVKTFADTQMEKAAKTMAKAKPTEGMAWFTSLVPQMVPTAVGVGATILTKNPQVAKITGRLGMALLSGSSAGAAMYEAREAGASDAEVRAAGLLAFGTEILTEKIPMDRYIGRLTKTMPGVPIDASDVTTMQKKAADVVDELQRANQALGGRLFTAKNVKDYATDVLAEGSSEFAAEAIGTLIPMIYKNPEDYPTLKEVIENGFEGFKAGMFMGSVMGGASKALEHRQQRSRRKQQGYVDVTEIANEDGTTDVAEVLGTTEDGKVVVLRDGATETIEREQLGEVIRYGFDEFDSGHIIYNIEESRMVGESIKDAAAKADANNMLSIQEEKVRTMLGLEADADVAEAVGDPVAMVRQMMAEGKSDAEVQTILDYANAAAVVDGMVQRVRDDIDSRVAESDAAIDMTANTNGRVISATTNRGEKVYVVVGNVVNNEHGNIDTANSDQSIVVYNPETGKREMMDSKNLAAVDSDTDVAELKATAADAIREEMATAAAGEIDGVLPMNAGDTYMLLDENGMEHQAQIVGPAEDGSIVVNIDGQQAAMTAEDIQAQNKAYNMQRAQMMADAAEQVRRAENVYNAMDEVMVRNDEGNVVAATITDYNADEDAYTLQLSEGTIDGAAAPKMGRAKMDARVESVNGEYIGEAVMPTDAAPVAAIPMDEQGNKVYESAEPAAAWADILADSDGDVEIAQSAVESMLEDKRKALAEIENTKPENGTSMAEKIAAQKAHKAAIEKAKADVAFWESVAQQKDAVATEDVATSNRLSSGTEVGLSEEDAKALLGQMKLSAESANDLELTPEAWEAEFGESGEMETPIGSVKMGENQYFKLLKKKRSGYFGMIKPTLTNPDVILEEYDPQEGAERQTKYLFVKTFIKPDGSRYVHFESVTVQKDTLEVSISSHEVNENALIKKMQQNKLLHLNEKFLNSDGRLIEPQGEGSDLVPTPNSVSSTDKDTDISETPQSLSEKVAEAEAETETDTTPTEGQAAVPSEAEQKREAILAKVKEWEEKTGVKVEVVERPSQVRSKVVRVAIAAGETVKGWYGNKTKKVFIYLPNMESVDDVTETFVHEVVAHKGLNALLGEKAYEDLCLRVYEDMLTDEQRTQWLDYVGYVPTDAEGKRVLPTQVQKAAAADEYIASLAERTDVEAESLWGKFVDMVREFLAKQGFGLRMSDDALQSLLRQSYRNLHGKAVESASSEAVTDEQSSLRFIGEKGAANLDKAEEATTRLDNLAVAREMEEAKKDALTIKMATGWERGADGKWRYETEDSVVKNIPTEENPEMLLSDVVNTDNDLLSTYPQLANIKVSIIDPSLEQWGAGYGGYYDSEENLIWINPESIGRIESIIAHEVQHAIQNIEGFAEGYHPDAYAFEILRERGFEWADFALDKRGDKIARDLFYIRRQAEDLVADGKYKYIGNALKNVVSTSKWISSDTKDYFNGDNESIVSEAKTATAREFDDLSYLVYGLKEEAYKKYWETAGEVEARNVSKRMDYTPEKRRAELASETEDVAREDQIFIYDALESAMGSRVDRRMADVSQHFADAELSETQRAIVDVFGGKENNLPISIKTPDGNTRRVVMRQGTENKAGTKHSLFRHYVTNSGAYTADELLLIEDVLANGERTEEQRRGQTVNVYKHSVDGVEYTILTENNNRGAEVFANFYTNRNGNARSSNTQLSAQADSITASEGKGTDNSANEQGDEAVSLSKKKKSLVGLHNISEDKLAKAIKQGGLANPSFAVVDIDVQGHEGYGDITLVMPSSLVDGTDVYTGDSWSPTYPPISLRVDESGWGVIDKRLGEIEDDTLRRFIRSSVRNYLDDGGNARLEYVFLKEKGNEAPIEYKAAKGMIGIRGLEVDLGVSDLLQGETSYEAYLAAKPANKRSFNMWRLVNGNAAERKKLIAQIRENRSLNEELGLTEDLAFGDFDLFVQQIKAAQDAEGSVDEFGTTRVASEKVDALGLREEYEAWLSELMEDAGAEEVFFSGFDRDGNRKYLPNTLENVSRHMRTQGMVNAYDNGGLSATRSHLLKRMNTLAAIRKNKDLLKGREKYDEVFKEMEHKLFMVISQLADMQEISSNKFMNIDYAEARLQEAITKRNPISYLNSEYGYQITKDGEFAQSLDEFIQEVKSMPSKYFEGKFERPVYLNEFAGAVVPKGTRKEIVDALEGSGLAVMEYERGDENSRSKAIEELADEVDEQVMFSRRFGGNSGYVGYSMSKRAAQAREEGRFPKTDFKKEYGVSAKAFDALVDAGIISDGEWHHTSMYGNKTTFYSWAEDGFADFYAEHKKEIDAAAKGLNADGSSFVEDVPVNPYEEMKYSIPAGYYEFRRQVEQSGLSSELVDAAVDGKFPEVAKASENNRLFHEAEAAINAAKRRNKKAISERLNEIFEDVNFSKKGTSQAEIEAVNERFNNALDSFSEENADSIVFDLGTPSDVLQAAGVVGKPMKLYGSKVAKKMRRHGFSVSELRDLPRAIANPIAVFNNYNEKGNRSILTELRTEQGNFLVTLSIGKGQDVDFNIVSSVFGKGDNNIINWLNNGYATYINKEKALNYLHLATPIVAASDNQELVSATKVVESFENPQISEEENEDSIRFSIERRVSPIEGYSYEEVIDIVGAEVDEVLSDYEFDNVEVVELWPNGSRMRGTAREDSDLDVVLFYKGNEKEDSMFNAIHETDISVGGIKIDVNPIQIESEADIVKYKLKSNRFDEEVLQQRLAAAQQKVANAKSIAELADAIAEREQIKNETVRFSRRGAPRSSLREEYDLKVGRGEKPSGFFNRFKNGVERFIEGYQDSMRALKVLQELVSEATGKRVETHEDAYMAENRMSSMNKAQQEAYERDFLKPMQREIEKLLKAGAEYDKIVEYLFAKHGLERNEVFTRRNAEKQAREEYADDLKKAQKELDKDPLDPDKQDRVNQLRDAIEQRSEELYFEYIRDYSGLTALTGSETLYKDLAEQIVADFEAGYETDALWDSINDATYKSLRTEYNAGLMSKETFDYVSTMFKYYIPLRGWSEDVAGNEYLYVDSGKPRMTSKPKKATGRRSLADDPIATIGHMGGNAIVRANRNKMKQHFLNFALNHPTELLTVTEQWYVYNPITKQWERSTPDIPIDATGDEVADIVRQHEADMKALGAQAKKEKGGEQIGMHVTKPELKEHEVRVMQGGKEYVIYVNGDPRAAQALNGLTNPHVNEGTLNKIVRGFNNFMAQAFTSSNPAFILENLRRDIMWAGTAVAVKENGAYTAKYSANVAEIYAKAMLPRLIKKWQDGKLDLTNPTERYFDEFMRNGGETGFTQLNTVNQYKKDIARFVRRAKGGPISIADKANVFRYAKQGVEFLNRSAEDTSRFAVYMTSREMGRDVARSIYDAKEITVNFNKKGSGGSGAELFTGCYVFFNAAVQSLRNALSLWSNNKVKATGAMLSYGAMGMALPLLNMLVMSMCGDDDEAYWDLPEWTRRNNLVFYCPWSENGFFVWPLPHEIRPIYGMSEALFSLAMGKSSKEDTFVSIATSFSSLLPMDFTGNGGNLAVNLTPTAFQPIVQLMVNKDYFGKPIYKDSEFLKNEPEHMKAYKSAAPLLVDMSEWLNEVTGGNDVRRGAISINPDAAEHLIGGYFGGAGKFVVNTYKTIAMTFDEDMRELRNVPIVNKMYVESSEERTAGSHVNKVYFDAQEEAEETNWLLKGYTKRASVVEYAEDLAALKQDKKRLARAELMREAGRYEEQISRALKEAERNEDKDLIDTLSQRRRDLRNNVVRRIEEINASK